MRVKQTMLYVTHETEYQDPETFDDSTASPDKEPWKEARNKELALSARGVTRVMSSLKTVIDNENAINMDRP